ncbi:MAG: tRNA pseudouridine(38-40) synthase TruA [Clostridia bacterium]|nr:tRNA pseudouridine(38-40) synthase TruA [Clostridia bacterium]
MRRIRLIISYDGTNYVGWQVQPNGVSVQALLEKALFELTGEQIRVEGSGRTDSGVHAKAQVAHFNTEARMAADKFAIAMNMHLPPDIRVLFSEECDPTFHARFSAKRKVYSYTVQLGPHADVFLRTTSLHLHYIPDVEAMQKAAAAVIGTHDFNAFKCADSSMENTVRTITRSEWNRNGNLLVYTVEGNGFLYNMVRILVGTMLEIGSGKRPVSDMENAIETGSRTSAGATAPARGLRLERVIYPDFDTEEVLNRG